MTEAIYYEAGGESFEGKTAVAQVVINRTQDGRFPTDICDVVYQKSMHRGKILCQFSWVCEQRRRSVDDSLWRESKYIAYLALTMNIINVNIAVHNAIFFHSVKVKPNWFGKQKVTQIGNHIFYAKLQNKSIQ
jgi:spore germination cell wall hydrolase CwlJ-like protein